MVSTPSLPSAAHELADSVFLTVEEAERFLQKFPLVHILECVLTVLMLRPFPVCLLAQQAPRLNVDQLHKLCTAGHCNEEPLVRKLQSMSVLLSRKCFRQLMV